MLCSNVPGTGHEETKVGDTFTHRKAQTTQRGFEPLRAEPNGFLVHLLNHSDTVSLRIATFGTLANETCGLRNFAETQHIDAML